MINRFTIIPFFVVFVFTSNAQDLRKDLLTMNKSYEKVNTILMEVSYRVYLDGIETPDQTETGVLKKAKQKVYSEEFNGETLINDNYYISVDHETQTVVVDKAEKEKKVSPVLPEIDSDSLATYFDKVKYNGIKKGAKSYYLTYKTGNILSTEIWMDAKVGYLKKVKTVYREKMEVEDGKFSQVVSVVEYTKIQPNVHFTSTTFSEKKYVTITDKNVVLAPKYKEYQLINYLK